MSNIRKVIILVVVVVLIAGAVYVLGGKSSDVPADGLVRENFDSVNSGENQEFLRVLKNLENVSLDGSILTTEAFMSLVDFSLQLNPEPTGRANPFRPIDITERALANSQNATATTSP
ncbi:MAG TPA: hypothetical protein VJB98_00450 [Candidatus Paceibacterota bacterium]